MQRNESRAQMRPGKTPRSPSTSSSILGGSILGEENLSNEAEAETEDGSVFSTKEETNSRPTRMDVLMEAGAAHYVPIHTAGRQRTDTLKEKINLTMSKLITWSKQVANGMDYLSSRNVIHGDLASRYSTFCSKVHIFWALLFLTIVFKTVFCAIFS